MGNSSLGKTYVDQMGREIQLPATPQRIVSLVPSQTELLYHLGLEKYLVGQTIFCVHPKDAFKTATKVGGTKKLHIDKIIELKPDLIIANKEENDQSQIEALGKDFPVWVSDISTLEDAYSMIVSVGELTDTYSKATDLVETIQLGFAAISNLVDTKTCLYLIWQKPWMAAGKNTFINAVLEHTGFMNVFEVTRGRYPEIGPEEIPQLNPDFVFLSSEPFPFTNKHIDAVQKTWPKAKVMLLDGEMMSWYGSRLLLTPGYIKAVLTNPV